VDVGQRRLSCLRTRVEHLIQSPVQAPLYDHNNHVLRLHRALDTAPQRSIVPSSPSCSSSGFSNYLKTTACASNTGPCHITVSGLPSSPSSSGFSLYSHRTMEVGGLPGRLHHHRGRTPMRTLSSTLRKTTRRLVSMAVTWP